MSELYLLTTIARRTKLKDIVELYFEEHVDINYVTLGGGTISFGSDLFSGYESREKAIIFSVISDATWERIKIGLERKIKIDIPDTAVAFLTPLSSIGGKKELEFFTDGQTYIKGEESTLKNTDKELIMIICNQGYSDQVMDAARAVGARGGTVIHAQGTGQKKSEKFLEVSLATEKDVIYVVVKKEKKNDIMQAIMKDAGLETPAKAVCFSLPVTETAGIKFYEE